MKQKQLNRLSEELLGPILFAIGFDLDHETYFRRLSSGVINIMSLEHDPRTTDTFRAMCGLNSDLSCGDEAIRNIGYIGAQHLTENGWDVGSGHWACANELEARSSLTRIAELISTVVEPWFQAHTTYTSVADVEEKRFAVRRAKLYLADGSKEKAMAVLKEFLEDLKKPKSWMSEEQRIKDQQEAEALLGSITQELHTI